MGVTNRNWHALLWSNISTIWYFRLLDFIFKLIKYLAHLEQHKSQCTRVLLLQLMNRNKMHFNAKTKIVSEKLKPKQRPLLDIGGKNSKQVGKESTNMFVCLCIWIIKILRHRGASEIYVRMYVSRANNYLMFRAIGDGLCTYLIKIASTHKPFMKMCSARNLWLWQYGCMVDQNYT